MSDRRRSITPFLALLLVGLAFTACSGKDRSNEEPPPPDARIPVAWEGSEKVPGPLAPLARWFTDTTYVTVQPEGVTGYDLESGDRLWRADLPAKARVCAASSSQNARGVGGLVMTRGKVCNRAAAIDTSTGKLAWVKPLSKDASIDGPSGVSVGDATLTADVDCGAVRRFDIRDGSPLPAPTQPDRKCAHEASHDGKLLAIQRDPETADTPDDHGTGFIPPHDSRAWFELHDADSGALLWRRRADDAELHRLVSSDPVALETTEHGHQQVRVLDARGRTLRTIGKRLDYGADMQVLDIEDDLLLATYTVRSAGNVPRVYAYDLTTGKEVWAWDPGENAQVLGTQGGGLLVAHRLMLETDGGGYENQVWLSRHELNDPDEAQVLGQVSATVDPNSFAWHDDRLVATDDDELVAYDLPAEAQEESLPESSLPMPELSDGDIEPVDTVDACEAVTADTRRSLGFRSVTGPPPASCRWEENDRPEGMERSLAVTVSAMQPQDGTAVEEAESEFARLERDTEVLDGAKPLKGVGDEAVLARWSSVSGIHATTAILVRWRNVVLQVESRQATTRPESAVWIPAVHQVEHGTITAAGDVLHSLGADRPDLATAPPGSHTRAEPICPMLSGDAEDVVPGLQPTDLAPHAATDRRVSGCRWSSEEDEQSELTVRVYAVPGSTTTGPRQTAQDIFENSTHETTAVPGIGDEAVLDRWGYDDGRLLSRELVARQGNLLVFVGLDAWHQPTAEQMEEDVARLAKKVLAAHR